MTITYDIRVTSRPRTDDTYTVFVRIDGDDPMPAGIITRISDGWQAVGLVYQHRSGAALDIARRFLNDNLRSPIPYNHRAIRRMTYK